VSAPPKRPAARAKLTVEEQISDLRQLMNRAFDGVNQRITDVEATTRTLHDDVRQLFEDHIKLDEAVRELREVMAMLREMTATVGHAARLVEFIDRQRKSTAKGRRP